MPPNLLREGLYSKACRATQLADCIYDHFRHDPESPSLTADIIDVFIAIDVPDPGAFRAFDEEWFSADVAKRARRVYAARDVFFRSGK
jgi:hypothetical protein